VPLTGKRISIRIDTRFVDGDRTFALSLCACFYVCCV
jgi:hypothetical protein